MCLLVYAHMQIVLFWVEDLNKCNPTFDCERTKFVIVAKKKKRHISYIFFGSQKFLFFFYFWVKSSAGSRQYYDRDSELYIRKLFHFLTLMVGRVWARKRVHDLLSLNLNTQGNRFKLRFLLNNIYIFILQRVL